MSLFGALMGSDIEEDTYFGPPMNMMNSMIANPFGGMAAMPMGFPVPSLMSPPMMGMQPQRQYPNAVMNPAMNPAMHPFGFQNVDLFPSVGNRQMMDNCHSFSSSTMMSMTTGPDGRPQVYQASSSTRTAPGGIRETKKAVADSRSGTKKMAIGHHIGERGHIVERKQNFFSGDREDRIELINLNDEDSDVFDREWQTRARSAAGGLTIEDITDQPAIEPPPVDSSPRGATRRIRPAPSTRPSTVTKAAGGDELSVKERHRTGPPDVKDRSPEAAIIDLTNSPRILTKSTFTGRDKPRKRDHPDGGHLTSRPSKQHRGGGSTM